MLGVYMTGFFTFLGTAMFIVGYVSNTNLFPEPLTAEEESRYIDEYMNGDEEARNILIERNLRLVAHITKKYSSTNIDRRRFNFHRLHRTYKRNQHV